MPTFSRGARAAMAVLVLCAGFAALAQQPAATPARDDATIRLIVPFAAGTPTDVIARTIGQGMARSLGRSVVVDNRPGAAGGIGTEAVAGAPPDGQTLLLTVNSPVTINPLLYAKLRYDPMKDLAPLAMVASGGYLIVAHPSAGMRSVADLTQAARARPGKINYASYGPGSMSHMCAEIYQSITGTQLYHVPYKAGSLNDILGGQVELGFEPIGPTVPHVQAGRLQALGVTSARRIEALSGVPTVSETLAGYECTAWVGVLAPARTPAALRARYEQAILAVAGTPEFARQMRDVGGLFAEPAGEARFREIIRADHEKWARIVRPLNLRLD